MSVTDRVRELVLPVLAERRLAVYDVELAGPVLRVVIDSADGRTDAIDLDVVADTTRAVSRVLDDVDPITSRYTLEVTTPGLERTLRTPSHFERAVGEKVKVKTAPGVESDRRIEGILETADPSGITVRVEGDLSGESALRRLGYDDITRARTVFDWGPAPKPGAGGQRGGSAPSGAKPGDRRTAAGTSDEKRERKR